MFAVTSKNGKGSSADPAVSFQRMPARGERVPGAPTGLEAAQVEGRYVALTWRPPAGSPPDFYVIGITQVDAAGQALSETNTIPFANTSALIRDLEPGNTYVVGAGGGQKQPCRLGVGLRLRAHATVLQMRVLLYIYLNCTGGFFSLAADRGQILQHRLQRRGGCLHHVYDALRRRRQRRACAH